MASQNSTQRYMKLAIAVIWCLLLLIITETARAEFPTPETPVRVYAPGAFNFEIIGQESDYEVTLQDGAVSLFEGPFMEYGVVGLLGHDYLAGAEFYELERGDWLVVWLEGGGLEAYQITEMRRFQAVGLDYPFQALADLETGSVLSEEEVFEVMYRRPGGLVLQTCIDGGWGLAFWVSELKAKIAMSADIMDARRWNMK